MASSIDFLQYVLEQLSGMDDISYRKMMGEFIIYKNTKIIGGIYDDRFLIKPTNFAKSKIVNIIYEKPYEGAKDMILVENIDDRKFVEELIAGIYDELPCVKQRNR